LKKKVLTKCHFEVSEIVDAAKTMAVFRYLGGREGVA
jgi:hypothetical protein